MVTNRIIRIKNATSENGTFFGQIISANAYFDLNETEARSWAESEEIFNFISNGDLLVNDGVEDLTNPVKGFKWLEGNIAPPKSSDGQWQVELVPSSNMTGNRLVQWSFYRFANVDANINEYFVIPNGKTLYINHIRCESPNLVLFGELYYQKKHPISGGYSFSTLSPFLSPNSSYQLQVRSTVTAMTTREIPVSATFGYQLSALTLEKLYAVVNPGETDASAKYFTILSANPATRMVYTSSLPWFTVEEGAKLALAELPITTLGGNSNSFYVKFDSPLKFVGDGDSYLRLNIQNLHSTEAGYIAASLNGWLTDTE